MILAFDADDAGRWYTKKVKAAVDIPFKVKFPKEGKKDWNEVLSLKAKPL